MRFPPFLLTLFALPLLACGSEGSVIIEGTSSSPAYLGEDADADGMKLLLTIREIHAHVVGGPDDGDRKNGRDGIEWKTKKGKWRVATLDNPRTIDLLALEDRPVRLGHLDLPEGKITQIRLFLDEDGPNEVIHANGRHCSLFIPSAKQTGIKVIKPFKLEVDGDEEVVLGIDFNLRESIRKDEGCAYKLSPVFKVKIRD